MSDDRLKELCFLLAKFLKTKFPSLATEFISQCESQFLFPRSVFMAHPSFQDLDTKNFPGIPDDQLLRILESFSGNPALSSILSPGVCALSPVTRADDDLHELSSTPNPLATILPFCHVIGHRRSIWCMAIDRTSQLLLTGSDDTTIKIWDLTTCSLLTRCSYHTNVITELVIHPSNLFFAASSHDHTVSLISLLTGKLIQNFSFTKEVHMVKFSPCGRYLGAACQDGTVQIWCLDEIRTTVDPHIILSTISGESAAWLDFSVCSKFIVYSGDPTELHVYSVARCKIVSILGHTSLPDYVQFGRSSTKRILSVCSKDRTIRVWDC